MRSEEWNRRRCDCEHATQPQAERSTHAQARSTGGRTRRGRLELSEPFRSAVARVARCRGRKGRSTLTGASWLSSAEHPLRASLRLVARTTYPPRRLHHSNSAPRFALDWAVSLRWARLGSEHLIPAGRSPLLSLSPPRPRDVVPAPSRRDGHHFLLAAQRCGDWIRVPLRDVPGLHSSARDVYPDASTTSVSGRPSAFGSAWCEGAEDAFDPHGDCAVPAGISSLAGHHAWTVLGTRFSVEGMVVHHSHGDRWTGRALCERVRNPPGLQSLVEPDCPPLFRARSPE